MISGMTVLINTADAVVKTVKYHNSTDQLVIAVEDVDTMNYIATKVAQGISWSKRDITRLAFHSEHVVVNNIVVVVLGDSSHICGLRAKNIIGYKITNFTAFECAISGFMALTQRPCKHCNGKGSIDILNKDQDD